MFIFTVISKIVVQLQSVHFPNVVFYLSTQSASNTAQQSQIENLFDSDISVEENVKNNVSCDIIMWH